MTLSFFSNLCARIRSFYRHLVSFNLILLFVTIVIPAYAADDNGLKIKVDECAKLLSDRNGDLAGFITANDFPTLVEKLNKLSIASSGDSRVVAQVLVSKSTLSLGDLQFALQKIEEAKLNVLSELSTFKNTGGDSQYFILVSGQVEDFVNFLNRFDTQELSRFSEVKLDVIGFGDAIKQTKNVKEIADTQLKLGGHDYNEIEIILDATQNMRSQEITPTIIDISSKGYMLYLLPTSGFLQLNEVNPLPEGYIKTISNWEEFSESENWQRLRQKVSEGGARVEVKNSKGQDFALVGHQDYIAWKTLMYNLMIENPFKMTDQELSALILGFQNSNKVDQSPDSSQVENQDKVTMEEITNGEPTNSQNDQQDQNETIDPVVIKNKRLEAVLTTANLYAFARSEFGGSTALKKYFNGITSIPYGVNLMLNYMALQIQNKTQQDMTPLLREIDELKLAKTAGRNMSVIEHTITPAQKTYKGLTLIQKYLYEAQSGLNQEDAPRLYLKSGVEKLLRDLGITKSVKLKDLPQELFNPLATINSNEQMDESKAADFSEPSFLDALVSGLNNFNWRQRLNDFVNGSDSDNNPESEKSSQDSVKEQNRNQTRNQVSRPQGFSSQKRLRATAQDDGSQSGDSNTTLDLKELELKENLSVLLMEVKDVLKRYSSHANIIKIDTEIENVVSEYESYLKMKSEKSTDFRSSEFEKYVSSYNRLKKEFESALNRLKTSNLQDIIEDQNLLLEDHEYHATIGRTGEKIKVTFSTKATKSILNYSNKNQIRKLFEAILKGVVATVGENGIKLLTGLDDKDKSKSSDQDEENKKEITAVEVKILGKGPHVRLFGCMNLHSKALEIKVFDPQAPDTKQGYFKRYSKLCH